MEDKLKDFLLGQDYVRVKLKLTKTNHFEIKATINGVKGLFILDTGASNSCVGFEAAEKFDLKKVKDSKIAGYKIYWRDTTSPIWQNERFIGNVNSYKLKGIVIDNFFFGISTVGKNGFESQIVFPNGVFKN